MVALSLVIEEVTSDNHPKWENYFEKEYRLYQKLSNLFHKLKYSNDGVFLKSFESFYEEIQKDGYVNPHVKKEIESIFKIDSSDRTQCQRVFNFLQKIKTKLDDFDDPTLNALMHNKLNVIPNGFHIASYQASGDVVMW